MDLTLIRDYYRTHTYGRIPEFQIVTLERPWIPDREHGSRPEESCIPEGVYTLDPHSTDKYPDTWALVNHDNQVYHWPGERPDDKGRYACVFHSGAWVRHTLGCILPGMRYADLRDPEDGEVKPAVARSSDAMSLLRDALGSGSHRLKIEARWG